MQTLPSGTATSAPPIAPMIPALPDAVAPLEGPIVSPRWLATALGVTIHRGPTDRMRWLTWLTLIGGVVGVVSAVLGRIPFDLPMPTHLVGMVCPTCGLTRGTVSILRGDLALAFRYNPLSFAVPVAGVAAVARALVGLAGRQRWLNVRYRPTRLAWALGGGAVAALWAYQQSNAMFIMHSHLV